MLYRLMRKQLIPAPIESVWHFFSRPENLKTITPDYMGFDILSSVPPIMEAGIIIEYIVRPLAGIPMRWVTEITHLYGPRQGAPPYFFVDEQRFGPYAFWHHRHEFHETNEGVLMIDLVHYKLPLGKVGRLFHPWVIRPRLEEIFDFRERKINEIFRAKEVLPVPQSIR
ncbi:MAG: SRPBCC family protein [Bacteroidia bacterium]|nr:SRPBCC family protein [Bacteroidia bacterium]MCX7651571.1 SRPBCC family protein [Bacteroidia bacterium]MDW8417253.1 SRPBCC family protein [Bacteroidia bacterium]